LVSVRLLAGAGLLDGFLVAGYSPDNRQLSVRYSITSELKPVCFCEPIVTKGNCWRAADLLQACDVFIVVDGFFRVRERHVTQQIARRRSQASQLGCGVQRNRKILAHSLRKFKR
jgi:hypothetical protein